MKFLALIFGILSISSSGFSELSREPAQTFATKHQFLLQAIPTGDTYGTELGSDSTTDKRCRVILHNDMMIEVSTAAATIRFADMSAGVLDLQTRQFVAKTSEVRGGGFVQSKIMGLTGLTFGTRVTTSISVTLNEDGSTHLIASEKIGQGPETVANCSIRSVAQ